MQLVRALLQSESSVVSEPQLLASVEDTERMAQEVARTLDAGDVIARRHKEYSPYFPLFDHPAFDQLSRANWKHAAVYVQKEVFKRINDRNQS